jgi:hypothetical protein
VQAHNLIGEIEDDKLTLQYKACYARICDSKRKFLEAATHYYDLSQSGAGVQCVLLAVATDQHARNAVLLTAQHVTCK